uniref:Uncharacterized protein n=1 Tax=Glossina brevipalpis TaxID=37001 RepID=A0A1A9VZA4_9MUSC
MNSVDTFGDLEEFNFSDISWNFIGELDYLDPVFNSVYYNELFDLEFELCLSQPTLIRCYLNKLLDLFLARNLITLPCFNDKFNKLDIIYHFDVYQVHFQTKIRLFYAKLRNSLAIKNIATFRDCWLSQDEGFLVFSVCVIFLVFFRNLVLVLCDSY